ncbi:hypothetical protein ZEAMMB73_Zm00001d044740 [Zea mays]|uniref:DUF7895 domain-containing protein n=1 Tax=Zea mays TaxID=4577 RepID=A0A1D6NR13_MAIZE|nr:hypothetical protein ZEAMMB73_Zm00001d044740 [Zea mays]AQL00762.1 hypothetical protein ZEAMMB73_Zm00001d044740 [Zea mays]AQL00765.1 hypothetical protein ZEAMMB73_Zm00001d044740 [Zea mays]AQL00771.1 hypothetical protein ZEAMMB73_Zm00001d044740 [Zea mays]AQL00775.1 hypothetical protein ZEAMMB73_Zm00001d044740 [Zea mays]
MPREESGTARQSSVGGRGRMEQQPHMFCSNLKLSYIVQGMTSFDILRLIALGVDVYLLLQQYKLLRHSGAKVPDCGGTGLCSRCKGECFVFKQLSKETATRSHKAAKNMATGYTSGLSTNGPTATSTPPPACLHKMAGVLPTINTHVKRSWDVHSSWQWKSHNRTMELVASSGVALGLALIYNKALFPVRVPITIAFMS